MVFLAASALEKMQTLPPATWAKIGIAIVVIVAVVLVFRRVMKMNKLLGGIVAVVAMSIFFFSWVYNRSEPKFMTPIIDKIAPFFPSAGAYNAKQGSDPKPRR